MKSDLFQFSGHCWVFQICWPIEYSTLTASSFRIWNSSAGIPSGPLALFMVMLPKAHLTLASGYMFIYFVTGSLYLMITVPISPTPESLSASRKHQSVVCICEFGFFFCSFWFVFVILDTTYKWEIIWYLPFSDFFHLAQYLQGPSILSQIASFPFSFHGWIIFLVVCVCVPQCFCPFIHQ